MQKIVKNQVREFNQKYGTEPLALSTESETDLKEKLIDPTFHVKKYNTSLYLSPDETLGPCGSYGDPSKTILGNKKWLSYKWVTQNLDKGTGWYYCHAHGVKTFGNTRAIQGRLNKSVIAKAIKEFDPGFKTLEEDNLWVSGWGNSKGEGVTKGPKLTPEQQVTAIEQRIAELKAQLANK